MYIHIYISVGVRLYPFVECLVTGFISTNRLLLAAQIDVACFVSLSSQVLARLVAWVGSHDWVLLQVVVHLVVALTIRWGGSEGQVFHAWVLSQVIIIWISFKADLEVTAPEIVLHLLSHLPSDLARISLVVVLVLVHSVEVVLHLALLDPCWLSQFEVVSSQLLSQILLVLVSLAVLLGTGSNGWLPLVSVSGIVELVFGLWCVQLWLVLLSDLEVWVPQPQVKPLSLLHSLVLVADAHLVGALGILQVPLLVVSNREVPLLQLAAYPLGVLLVLLVIHVMRDESTLIAWQVGELIVA